MLDKYLLFFAVFIQLSYNLKLLYNEIKYASQILLVIAAISKISCKHELWLVARVI